MIGWGRGRAGRCCWTLALGAGDGCGPQLPWAEGPGVLVTSLMGSLQPPGTPEQETLLQILTSSQAR